MRLLHLLPSLNPAAGGVSQAVRTLIAGLQPLGVANEVATADAPGAAFLQGISFPVQALGPGKTSWNYAPRLLPWLQKNMADYDAVIVHGLWQYQSYAAHRAVQQLRGKKPKLWVMPHGMLDPYFQKAKGRKLKAARNIVFWKLIDGQLVNGADGLLFTCETEKLLARQPFRPYRPRQEQVVGLGIEPPPPYRPAMQQAFREKLNGTGLPAYWLYISRIHKKKGVDLLITAYRQLAQQTGNLPPLVIAGPGLDTPYGQYIQQLAQGLPVYFPGMQTGDAKWGAFYGCEVFILPSHQENFGIAVVEALACGKPVLISDQVNIWREIVEQGGGLVAPDTLEGTLQLLQGWLQMEPHRRQLISDNTPVTFRRFFSLENVSQQLFRAVS